MTEPISVQPDWCRYLPIQQQSVLLLAARGPDGMRKHHPAKDVIRAYRACVLHAASAARPLRVSEHGDSFMSAHHLHPWHWRGRKIEPLDTPITEREPVGGVRRGYRGAVATYFDHVDEVPHHYHLHLLHGAQILAAHHPSAFIRGQWEWFYEHGVDDMHLAPESIETMNDRLNDFGRSPGGRQPVGADARLSAVTWAAMLHVKILDWDGFDEQVSPHALISREEFDRRLAQCTIGPARASG